MRNFLTKHLKPRKDASSFVTGSLRPPTRNRRAVPMKLVYVVISILVLVVVSVLVVRFVSVAKKDASLLCIDLAGNYLFGVPENYKADVNSAPGSVIVLGDYVESFNPNDYQGLLNKGIIVLQSFPSLNKNDNFFEKYVRKLYKSSEARDVDISFEQIDKNKVSTVVIRDKDGKTSEFIKVVNLVKPVIIASSGPSEALNYILRSIRNIEPQDRYIEEIKNQIMLVGPLLKSSMNEELYSLFSKEAKEKISESDFEIILGDSRGILNRNINLNGGLFDLSKNMFSCRLIFVDPENKPDVRMGKLVLVKEKGEWLVSELEIPKDTNPPPADEGTNKMPDMDQDAVNKALESIND